METDDKSMIIDSEGHIYDTQVFADGVLFMARHPEVSLIITDERRADELTHINEMIDELNDNYFQTTERIASMLLGF